MSFRQQAVATIGLGLKSIPRRLGSSASVTVAIALVVIVLLGFASMGNGFRQMLDGSGSSDVAVILRSGATTAQTSLISPEQLAGLDGAPGIARLDDRPSVSPEMSVIVGLDGPGGKATNLVVRGIAPESGFMTRGIAIVTGRAPRPGSTEIIIGSSAIGELANLHVGSTVRMGSANWTIVGVFAADGSIYGAEARADLHVVQSIFRRGVAVQSARVALAGTGSLGQIQRYLASNPQLELTAKREDDFFRSLAKTSGTFIEKLGWPLALMMAVGALAGACNAMYTSIDGRRREIATLRTLGYGRSAIFLGVMAESLALAALGALAGTLLGYLVFNGMRTSTAASSMGQVAFAFKISPPQIIQAFGLAVVIGLLGGLAPALKAMRLPLTQASRE